MKQHVFVLRFWSRTISNAFYCSDMGFSSARKLLAPKVVLRRVNNHLDTFRGAIMPPLNNKKAISAEGGAENDFVSRTNLSTSCCAKTKR